MSINTPKPSPNPNNTRHNNNAGTDVANNGVTTVDIDHSKTAKSSTFLPPNLLAAQAPIIWLVKYPKANADKIQPK